VSFTETFGEAQGTGGGTAEIPPEYVVEDELNAALDARFAALLNAAPAALDTLNELAAALGDDPNFRITILNSLAEKAALLHKARHATGGEDPIAPADIGAAESGHGHTDMAKIGTGTRDGTRFLRDDGTWQAAGGAADDFLSLSRTEVALSAAATLDAAAFGKMHVLSGPADFAVTLPPASGNAGKVVAFRVAGSAAALVTLDGNLAETIDGQETRIVWAQESALLLCDGAGWTKIAGRTRPMGCRVILANDADPTRAQQINHNTSINVNFTHAPYDYGGIADTANDRVLVRRAGQYEVGVFVYISLINGAPTPRVLASAVRESADAARNGITVVRDEDNAYSSTSYPTARNSAPADMLAGERLRLGAHQMSGNTRYLYGSTGGAACAMSVTETPTW